MSEQFAYVAIRRQCGCMIAAIIDSPEMKDTIPTQIARWYRLGMTVERVSDERVRQELKRCKHRPQQGNLL